MLRLATSLLLCSTAFAQDYYSAFLEGAQEVPPVASAGRGWAVVRFDPGTSEARVFVYHEGLSAAPSAAHLHLAPAGANGGVVFGLTATSPSTFTGTSVLAPGAATALASGNTYLNVHTPTNPGGEIRGQVVPSASTRFTGRLEGSQEVPPVATGGTGTVVAYAHEPENRVVYMVETSGLGNVIAAHFHQAPAGSNGPVIVPLNGVGGTYCGVSDRLSESEMNALFADGVYCNVHTGAFPGGELRGQLIKDQGDHFVAEISNAPTVPNTGSPGIGGARLVLGADGVLTFDGRFSGLVGSPTVAHVHVAPPGSNGPVVFGLSISPGDFLSGTHTPTPAQLSALRAGNWYVNIHSTTNPGGEIRGQLMPASLPTTYGGGCLGSNGVRPQIGATGFASIGSRFTIDLYGSIPSTIAIFSFGASRDQLTPTVPLPIVLTALGIASPRCYVQASPDVLLSNLVNPFGCASQDILVPLNPALRGSDHYCQYYVLDGNANPGGFVASNALTFTIQ
ncbi:MAG: CHRD domain-containing protein [Planctomycetes bacterium]|nr:CHRD domain-containing protein [Planctomycetota bacterium]